MNEVFTADPYGRVIREKPKAYLAAQYWDSDNVYGREVPVTRKENEQGRPKEDYKAKAYYVCFKNMDIYFTTKQ